MVGELGASPPDHTDPLDEDDVETSGLRSRLRGHPLVARALQAARILVVLLVVAAVAYAVIRDWAAVSDTIKSLSLGHLTLSLLAAVGALIATVKIWQNLIFALGSEIHGLHAGQVYLSGQLARYLPGSVWAFLLQAHLGRRHEIPRLRSLLAVLMTVGIFTSAGLTVAVFAIPQLVQHWGGIANLLYLGPLSLVALYPPILTWIANLTLRVLRRPPLTGTLSGRRIAAAFAWSLVEWVLLGAHLWLLVQGTPGGSQISFPLATATFALAVCAGFVAFLLPSGVGVREAIVVAGITSALAGGPALAVALVSRLLCTAADVLAAIGATVGSRLVEGRDERRADRFHAESATLSED